MRRASGMVYILKTRGKHDVKKAAHYSQYSTYTKSIVSGTSPILPLVKDEFQIRLICMISVKPKFRFA